MGLPWDYNGIISAIAPVWLGGKVDMRVTAIFILPSEAVGDPITAQLHLNAATWRGARKLTRGTTAWTGGCRRSLHTCKDQTQQEHFLMLWVTDKLYEADENGEINVSLQVVKQSWAKHDKGLFTQKSKILQKFKNCFWECFHSNSNINFDYFPLSSLRDTIYSHYITLTDHWWLPRALHDVKYLSNVLVQTALDMSKMEQNIRFFNLAQPHFPNTSLSLLQ